MLTLQFEDIILLVVMWLICGLISALVFIRFAVLRWGGQAVINALKNPTEEVRGAIAALVSMILVTPIETGRDKEGKPIAKPLFVFLGSELLHQFELRIRAKQGGITSGIERSASADPEMSALMDGSLLMGIPKRRKDQGIFDWFAEAAMHQPQVQQKVAGLVESTVEAIIRKRQQS